MITNSRDLQRAFAEASDGDVLRLAPGNYDSARLSGRDFDQGVTITSADPGNRAVFDTALHLKDVSGVTLNGIDIDPDGLSDARSYVRLFLDDADDVKLINVDLSGHIPTAEEGRSPATGGRSDPIVGFGHDMGMRVRDSDGLVMRDVEISDVRVALLLQDVEGATLDNIEIHSSREGINLEDVRDVTIENSWFHDLKGLRSGASGDHPDMIQYWGVNSSDGIHDLTIRNNLFEQPAGEWTQTIFGHLRGAPAGVSASDFTITGNVIVNGHPNAIRLRSVDGVEIRDNVLVPSDGSLPRSAWPKITLLDVEDAVVTDNALLPRHDGRLTNLDPGDASSSGIRISGNTALSTNRGDDDYWRDVLNEARNGLGQPASNLPEARPPEPEPTPSPTPRPAADEATEEPVAEPRAEPDQKPAPQPEEPAERGAKGSEAPRGEENSHTYEGLLFEGGASNDVLQAHSRKDSVLSGLGGNDRLFERHGDDTMVGGVGRDRFVVDTRSGPAGERDVIADLDFAEGDRLIFAARTSGTFHEDTDPANRLLTVHGGRQVHVRDLDDLREVVAMEAVTATSGADGLRLSFADAPDHAVEILTLTLDDVL